MDSEFGPLGKQRWDELLEQSVGVTGAWMQDFQKSQLAQRVASLEQKLLETHEMQARIPQMMAQAAMAAQASVVTPPPPRRIGRFSLPDPRRLDMDWSAMAIMSRCVVFKATENHMTGNVDYVAVSPLFDEIEGTAVVPVYEWGVEGDNVVAKRKAVPQDVPADDLRRALQQLERAYPVYGPIPAPAPQEHSGDLGGYGGALGGFLWSPFKTLFGKVMP